MKKVKVKLEIITPMFSFGANNSKDSKPEFRIPELKFLMRNTFRELYYFKDIENMKEKEDMLFGNTSTKSPISFKINNIEHKEPKEPKAVFMLPHKKIKSNENEYKKKAYTNCIGNLSEIVFYMMASNTLNLEIYINLLIQSSILGSLGRRSRKGFGSFIIKDTDGIESNKYLLQKSPSKILKKSGNYLSENCSDIFSKRKINKEKGQDETLGFNNYENNSLDFPYITKIKFVKIQENKGYLNLIKQISQLTHDRLYKKDGQDFTDDIVNKYKIKNCEINRNILGNCSRQSIKLNRFTSPIWVSFWENDDDKYMIIKELNYNYILNKLNIKNRDVKKANISYVDKYVEKLIKIGGAK